MDIEGERYDSRFGSEFVTSPTGFTADPGSCAQTRFRRYSRFARDEATLGRWGAGSVGIGVTYLRSKVPGRGEMGRRFRSGSSERPSSFLKQPRRGVGPEAIASG